MPLITFSKLTWSPICFRPLFMLSTPLFAVVALVPTFFSSVSVSSSSPWAFSRVCCILWKLALALSTPCFFICSRAFCAWLTTDFCSFSLTCSSSVLVFMYSSALPVALNCFSLRASAWSRVLTLFFAVFMFCLNCWTPVTPILTFTPVAIFSLPRYPVHLVVILTPV